MKSYYLDDNVLQLGYYNVSGGPSVCLSARLFFKDILKDIGFYLITSFKTANSFLSYKEYVITQDPTELDFIAKYKYAGENKTSQKICKTGNNTYQYYSDGSLYNFPISQKTLTSNKIRDYYGFGVDFPRCLLSRDSFCKYNFPLSLFNLSRVEYLYSPGGVSPAMIIDSKYDVTSAVYTDKLSMHIVQCSFLFS